MMFFRGYNGFSGGCFNNMAGGGWLSILFFGLIIIAAIVLVLVLVKSGKSTTKNNALDSLKMKYINGEISEEEYLKRKDVLSK